MSSKLNPDGQQLPPSTRRNWIWFSFQVIVRVVFAIWLRYRAFGIHRIPREGGGLILINHQSFLDPLLVGLPLQRPVSYLARDSLFHVPIIGWILRNTYVMPISRESAGAGPLKEAIRRMKHGFLVGIFPEGTRSSDGTVGPFKPGFVALVRRSKLPVYPVGIAGADRAFPRGSLFLRPAKVTVVFGEPISAERIRQLNSEGGEDLLVEFARSQVVHYQIAAERLRRRAVVSR